MAVLKVTPLFKRVAFLIYDLAILHTNYLIKSDP